MRRPGLLSLFALLLLCAIARAGDWTVLRYDGRDYLSMRNVADFYGLTNYERASNTLTVGSPGRTLRGNIGSNELYINNLKFILSYPIEEVDGQPAVSRMDLTKVIEPVLRPSRIRNAAVIDSIVLDPGHGGYDNGATSTWGYEKTYTLDVAFRTRAILEAQGLRVYMTRTRDEFIPLEDRVRFANAHPTALFIAIHFNSGGSDANGIETYTLAPRGVPSMAADGPLLSDLRPCAGNVCDAENMALACATHASLISHARLFDRGIKRARFVVIRDITIPGVLIEGGFLSNPADARLIASTDYRQEEAQCIAIAVRNYRNAVNTEPPMTEGRSVIVRNDVALNGSPAPIGESIQADERSGPAAKDVAIPTPSPVKSLSADRAPTVAVPTPSPIEGQSGDSASAVSIPTPSPVKSQPAGPASGATIPTPSPIKVQPPKPAPAETDGLSQTSETQAAAQAQNQTGSRAVVTPAAD